MILFIVFGYVVYTTAIMASFSKKKKKFCMNTTHEEPCMTVDVSLDTNDMVNLE